MKRIAAQLASSLLGRSGYAITRPRFHEEHSLDIRGLLADRIAEIRGDFYAIQIGANDGKTNDPIHHLTADPRWSLLAVEPLRPAFTRLRQTYAGKTNVLLVNAAVADRDSETTIYTLAPVEGRDMDDHLASFSKDVLRKHWRRVPDLERRIVATPVQTRTIATLVQESKFPRVDMLQIDTEGFDFEVMKLAFATGLEPPILAFEWEHLSQQSMWDCRCALIEHGYEWIINKGDVIASLAKSVQTNGVMTDARYRGPINEAASESVS